MNQPFLSLIPPRLLKLEHVLPKRLFELVKRFAYGIGPTETQLNKMKLLGRNIGLNENDVVASLGTSANTMGVGVTQKKAVYFVMLIAVVIIVWGLLFIWAVFDPETAPIKTYVPGTFYGTIKPQDFAIIEN